MFDRIFSAVLAFGVLAAGTLAIASAMLEQPAVRAVQLPRVDITVKRDVGVTSAGTHARSCG